MTASMIWGPGPYPVGSEVLGIGRHPRDGHTGVIIRLASGLVVLGAAGAIRSLPYDRSTGTYKVLPA